MTVPRWTDISVCFSLSRYTCPSLIFKHQIEFINENITDEYPVDLWNGIFQVSCELQVCLFNMGMRAPFPFQIIPNGTYSIFLEDGDVLAIQNVEDSSFLPSDDPLSGYVPSDSEWSVVGVEESGGDNEKVKDIYFSLRPN